MVLKLLSVLVEVPFEAGAPKDQLLSSLDYVGLNFDVYLLTHRFLEDSISM